VIAWRDVGDVKMEEEESAKETPTINNFMIGAPL
jgi:hypothetical protein